MQDYSPKDRIEVKTKVGRLIPVYKIEDHGRLKLTPIKYDKLGNIKSMQLQSPTKIKTPLGPISVEFISFYPGGEIKRIFPLNGKLSGYWSEDNEYELAKKMMIPTTVGVLYVKPICINFYDTGELKGITFWPKERANILFENKEVEIKTGLSFFRDGSIRSFEPSSKLRLLTPIGRLEALDPEPIGINGEKNSLSFDKNGLVNNISTISNTITVTSGIKTQKFTPFYQPSRCDDEKLILMPLKVEIIDAHVVFKHGLKIIGTTSINDKYVISGFL